MMMMNNVFNVLLFQVHVIAPQGNLGDQHLAPVHSVIPPAQTPLLGSGEDTETTSGAQGPIAVPDSASTFVSKETPVPAPSTALGSAQNRTQSISQPSAMSQTAVLTPLKISVPAPSAQTHSSPTSEQALPLNSAASSLIQPSVPGLVSAPTAALLAQPQSAATSAVNLATTQQSLVTTAASSTIQQDQQEVWIKPKSLVKC